MASSAIVRIGIFIAHIGMSDGVGSGSDRVRRFSRFYVYSTAIKGTCTCGNQAQVVKPNTANVTLLNVSPTNGRVMRRTDFLAILFCIVLILIPDVAYTLPKDDPFEDPVLCQDEAHVSVALTPGPRGSSRPASCRD